MTDELIPLLFTGFDYVWQRQRGRLDGITVEEYRWAPVADTWTVHDSGDGRWLADPNLEVPRPAPVPTIAWRTWHIADCLASYVAPHLGSWPLPLPEREWYAEPEPALAAMDVSFTVFRERVVGLGEDGIRRPLGPDWGPFGDDPWSALVVHALDEVAHHGAEIGLLRDLYGRLA